MEHKRYTVKQLLNDPSFIRWAKGDSNSKEARQWSRWIKESQQNRSRALEAQNKVAGFTFRAPEWPNIQDEWHEVQDEIIKKEQLITKQGQKHTDQNRDSLGVFFKAAAVLLIGAFVGIAVYMFEEPAQEVKKVEVHTLKTDYGQKKTLNLSDGSTIMLAANSTLTFKENWLEKSVRRIRLKGEAFFSITPTPQKESTHPRLIVETKDGTATVWGTRFTVNTYGSGTQVVLAEGEVRVNTKSHNKEIVMSPREMARFSETGNSIELEKVDPNVYTSWTTNELFFNNTPLSVLINRIERTYGLKVEVQDPEIFKRRLSGSVDFRSLESLTEAVGEIFMIDIKRLGDTLIIKSQ